MLITVTARLVRPHGTDEVPLPDTGKIEYRPASHGVHEGALRGRETVTAPIHDGVAEPVELTPGPWRVRVVPEHGSGWESWQIDLTEDLPEPVDLATLAPVITVNGEKWARGPAGEDGAPGRDGTDGQDGAPGADGHTPVIAWDDTTVVIDGVPGPDLQGPPGAPGSGVHQDLWRWVTPGKTPGDGQVTVTDGTLRIHSISAGKIDWGIVISRVTTGDHIGVQDQRDATIWAHWTATGPAVAAGDLYEIPVEFRADTPQGVDPTDGRTVVVAIAKQQGAATSGAGDVPIFSTFAAAQEWEAANPGKVALTIEEPIPGPDPDPEPSGPFITDTFSVPGPFFDTTTNDYAPLRTTETGETWVYGNNAIFTNVGHGPYGEVDGSGRAVATLGNYLSSVVAVPTDQVRVSMSYSMPEASHFRLYVGGYIVHVDPGGSRFRLMTSSSTGGAAVVQTQSTAPELEGTIEASFDGYTITVENNGNQVAAWSVTPRPSDSVGFSVPTGGWVDDFEVAYVA